MTFLHPLLLLGLAAAAIPALLHLLQRRTPPELEFPPVRYLTEAERQSARRLKIRHLVLLVLRTVLIVFLVLAAARPLVPTAGGSAHRPTALAVVLDNSLSSAVVVDGRPAFDRLRGAARASLADATTADRLWLGLTDGILRAGSRDVLLAAVDSAAPEPRRLDLVALVERAARVVDAEPLEAREVHVFSDLQRTALASPADVPRGVRVLALAPLTPPPNRGLSAARVAEGTVALSVGGTPDAGASQVTVRWRRRETARLLAAPGDAVAVPVPPTPPGWWVGEGELEADELLADNRRLFAWRVAPPARVTATEPGPFLEAALAVLRDGGRIVEGRDVTVSERPGAGVTVVVPPADAALAGQVNRALAGRGARWRFAGSGTPGPAVSRELAMLDSVPVARRYRLDGPPGDTAGVLARVNGEPWLVRDGAVILLGSRLDTAWTALPARPAFVPFMDALLNRVARGEAAVTEAEGPPGVVFDVRRGGRDTVGATVYGPDGRESDLTPAAERAARRALGGEVLDGEDFVAARFTGRRQADLSGLLLALALLVAAVELGVATLTR